MLENEQIYSPDEIRFQKGLRHIISNPGDVRWGIYLADFRKRIESGESPDDAIRKQLQIYPYDQEEINKACKIALGRPGEEKELDGCDYSFWPNFFQNKKITILTVSVIILSAIYGICLCIFKAPP